MGTSIWEEALEWLTDAWTRETVGEEEGLTMIPGL